MAYELITTHTSPNSSPREAYGGVTGKPSGITHHWWNTPEAAGTLESTVDFFVNKSPRLPAHQRTSAHYVISDTKVHCIVSPDLAAWHAGSTQGNAQTIGLEIDPRLPGRTLETVAEVCADLEKHYGPLKHYGHKDWSATACPGILHEKIPWIIKRTNELLAGATGQVLEAPAVKAAQKGAADVTPVNMVYPLPEGTRISQDFGQQGTKFNPATGGHTGRDYAVAEGTPVAAMANGKVLWADWATKLPGDDSQAGWESRWLVHKAYSGITVVIDHGEFLSLYAHLSRTDLNPGDLIRAGQTLGLSGSTGEAVTGPHMHWEVITKPYQWWANGYYGRVNPSLFIENNRTNFAPKILEEIMALYNTKQEFEDALERTIGKKLTLIHDELTPGRAKDKAAGSVFLMLYNINGHLESFKALFQPGEAEKRLPGAVFTLLHRIADKVGK